MSILFAGNFAHLLGAPDYHSTATTGRDAAYTSSHIEFPQVGNHSIGFSLNLLQADFPEIWLHCRMHAQEITDIASAGSLLRISDNDSNVNYFRAAKNNSTSPLFQAIGSTANTATTGGTYELYANTTYSMDLSVSKSGSSATVRWYVNGAQVSSLTRSGVNSTRWLSADILNNMGRRTTGTNNIFVSEVIIATSSTIGKRVATLEPSSPGHYAEWSGNPSSVNDLNPVTGITASSPGLRQTRVHTAAPAGTVETVMLAALMPGGNPPRASRLMRIGGTDYLSANPIAPGGNSSPPNIWSEFLGVNPATGVAWTTSDLAALDAGLRSESAS